MIQERVPDKLAAFTSSSALIPAAAIRCRWAISAPSKRSPPAIKIPLFLDACRILENSSARQSEGSRRIRQWTLADIVRETCALADGATMSALKDFLVRTAVLSLPAIGEASKRRRCRVFSTASSSRPAPWSAIAAGFAGNLRQRSLHDAAGRTSQISLGPTRGTVPVLRSAERPWRVYRS